MRAEKQTLYAEDVDILGFFIYNKKKRGTVRLRRGPPRGVPQKGEPMKVRKTRTIRSIFLTFSAVALFVAACFAACAPQEPPHEHTLVYVEAKEAGYATHGNAAYYRCDCGAIFTADTREETTLQAVTVRSETGFDKQTFTQDGYTLNYCLFEPEDLDKTADKAPLVLFLHGAGERGSDNQSQLKNAVLNVVGQGEWADAVVLAPQCPSAGNTGSSESDPNKWVETPWTAGNYRQAEVPESKPLHAAAQLVAQYAAYDYIDADRVYVVGLSMGGFGTWDILARYPDLFAAGVPICGGGPSDRIDVLKDIPVYAFHGDRDGTVPYTGTQAMYEDILAAGGTQILFKTFAGAGHAVWNDAISFEGEAGLPPLGSWLFSQHK